MEVLIENNAETASQWAARFVTQIVGNKPGTVLGLATGSTPVKLYKEWIAAYQDGNLDFSQVTTFNLDEYVGLPPDHPCSYRRFMQEHLFEHINVPADNVHIPKGDAEDIQAECERYEEAIRDAGGIDTQLLGIGSDGHIGFNEPSSSLGSRTRIKTLTEQTRRDNARFFNSRDEVPIHCITMGIGTIMDSSSIVLLAFGEQKAEAVADALEGPVSAMVPASVLQFHPHVKVFLDEAAASHLQKKDYYKWVAANKPEWQRF